MNRPLSVLVTPRDSVPYQELLYRDVTAAGVRVRYADGPTPSQTLNIALAPILLVFWRLRGYRILHIHWIFQFSLPWARHSQWARQSMEWWFAIYLRTAQFVGFKIIWTAHDLLPHTGGVFANDIRARAMLLSKAKIVIALSEATANELRELGARQVDVIPHGPFASPYPVTLTTEEARASFGFGLDDVVLTLIGRIETYKGADLLLIAAAQLPASSKIKILLAGTCNDEAYRDELRNLASEIEARVTMVFEWVPEEDVARYLQATDIAVFPFRQITNSGSVILAQSFGLPVVIPNLPSLSDIPVDAAIRFEPGAASLVTALLQAESLSESQYRKMSAAALAWSMSSDWNEIALSTVETYKAACRRDR
jgi:glycosyltransferase involved in cell wall biosynthesis